MLPCSTHYQHTSTGVAVPGYPGRILVDQECILQYRQQSLVVDGFFPLLEEPFDVLRVDAQAV